MLKTITVHCGICDRIVVRALHDSQNDATLHGMHLFDYHLSNFDHPVNKANGRDSTIKVVDGDKC